MPAYLPVRTTSNTTLGENKGMSSQTRSQNSERITTTTTNNEVTVESYNGGNDATTNNTTKTDTTKADIAGRISFKLRPFPSLGAAIPGDPVANPCA